MTVLVDFSHFLIYNNNVMRGDEYGDVKRWIYNYLWWT